MSDAETRAVSADVVTAELEADAEDDAPPAPTAKIVERAPSVPVEVLMAEPVTTALEDCQLALR